MEDDWDTYLIHQCTFWWTTLDYYYFCMSITRGLTSSTRCEHSSHESQVNLELLTENGWHFTAVICTGVIPLGPRHLPPTSLCSCVGHTLHTVSTSAVSFARLLHMYTSHRASALLVFLTCNLHCVLNHCLMTLVICEVSCSKKRTWPTFDIVFNSWLTLPKCLWSIFIGRHILHDVTIKLLWGK